MEEWRSIPGWEKLYEVSSAGRVRSLDRRVPHKKNGLTLYRGRLLKAGLGNKGKYYTVVLTAPGRSKETHYVHTLVLTAFVGPAPAGMECCHGPYGAHDNNLFNLRWDTRIENHADKKRFK